MDISKMDDSSKLRFLADWFDHEQSKRPAWFGTGVQEDLRRIADKLDLQAHVKELEGQLAAQSPGEEWTDYVTVKNYDLAIKARNELSERAEKAEARVSELETELAECRKERGDYSVS